MNTRTKKASPNIIAQETTTLPEGAQVTVFKTQAARKGVMSTSITLRAYFDNKTIDMRVQDGISAQNLKQYLGLIVREITRRRGMLSTKPSIDYNHPHSIHEFVLSMAHNGMFMLDDATGTTKAL
jgi:hypothetical protein